MTTPYSLAAVLALASLPASAFDPAAVPFEGMTPALFLGADAGVLEAPPVAGVPLGDPQQVQDKKDEGPQAALEFERKYRGPKEKKGGEGFAEEGLYPDAKPIPYTDTKNITPMTETLWSPAQLIADFKKNKKDGQAAIAVIVKTEFCCTNKFRPCAVTTAAFEKFSTPVIKKFKVYGAWVRNEKALPKGADAKTIAAKEAWDERVMTTYGFQQGPGATIVLIDPDTGRGLRTDAVQQQLYMEPFEKNQGATPVLEETLQKALEAFGTK